MDSLQETSTPTTITSQPNLSHNTSNFDTPDQAIGTRTQDDTSSSMMITDITEERIVTFTLKELSLKLQYGHSVSEFEHHLQNAADLIGGKLFTKWAEVLKLLRRLGYTNPKHYKVCVGGNHSILLDEKAECCPVCRKDQSLCIDYYVLGLNFQDWFCTEERCEQLLSHWRDKDEWLNTACEPAKISELWHGERWRDLSYFWDPSIETLLPEKCTNCKCIISKENLEQQMSDSGLTQVAITCSACKISHRYVPRYMKGDPRNQAIIIHEDGWASHSTSSKNSVAAITISKGCMSKLARAANKHAQVFSFIPVDQLPTDSPHKLDGFFEPLISEIEDIYVYGTEVYFKSAVPGYSPANDTPTLRLIPLLCTADLRAHSEMGLTSAGGRKGCRRCEVIGTYISSSNHYYYDHFLFRYHNPPSPRTARQNRIYGQEADAAATDTERRALTRSYGITGESIFYRFFDLCGFDPINDLVIDVMHSLCLNLIRSELEKHLLAELGPNQSIPVLDRDTNLGGVLDRKDLSQSLKQVNWTTELRDGRVPTICETAPSGKHKLGFWKAEEFGKFITVAPYVLRNIIPKNAYNCFILLNRIYQLTFSHALRIDGWTKEHSTLLRKLLWKHAILLEYLYGTKACTENVECSVHMVDDIERHSTLDNYWCFVYERLVKFYKQQTTNMKSLCKTFADRAQQLRFVDMYIETRTPLDTRGVEFNLEELEKGIILQAKTEQKGMEMKDFLSSVDNNALPPAVKEQYQHNGIFLGSSKVKKLSEQQKADITYWIQRQNSSTSVPLDEIGDLANCYSRILKVGELHKATVFRENEHVILLDADVEGREWVMKIKQLFTYGPVLSKYYCFVDGEYYVTKTVGGRVDYDNWTGQPMLIPRQFRRLCVQPLRYVDRKAMLYPVGERQPQYLVIDPEGPIDLEDVTIPYLPSEQEVVLINNGTLVHVSAVTANKVTGYPLRKIAGRNPRWTYQSREPSHYSVLDVVRSIEYEKHLRDFYLHGNQ